MSAMLLLWFEYNTCIVTYVGNGMAIMIKSKRIKIKFREKE